MLKLFNTMSKQKELVGDISKPLSIYTCGPTVYLDPHIGNWRTFVFYDTLVRTAQLLGYDTRHVINITDVGHLVSDGDDGDDKLDKQAKLQRKTAWEIAEHYTGKFLEGMHGLNMLTPYKIPKATDHIREQLAMVELLEKTGHTYQIDDGIYFDTTTVEDYGKLAGGRLKIDENYSRVEPNNQKRNPQDFALWKFSPQDEKRDMEWESPWGVGFPGWHIECSAMAQKYLGDTLSVHAGGIDHIPVHHTNEIAQSESANGKEFAKVWLHAEFMKVDGTKMSKSLGNVFTLEDVVTHGFTLLDFRLLLLQGHYRTETNFTWENLEGARSRLNSLRNLAELRWQARHAEASTVNADRINELAETLTAVLADDLNTPKALSVISEVESLCVSGINTHTAHALITFLQVCDKALGLDLLKSTPDISDDEKTFIAQRIIAKSEKNYQKADECRDILLTRHIKVLDAADNTSTWQRF